jgi:predicted RNA-binding Zn ribbon-like protein
VSERVFPVAVMAHRAAALTGAIRDGVETAEIAAILTEFGEELSTVEAESLSSLEPVADELYAIFAAESLESCVAEINAMLARWAHPPRLSDHHAGTAWHLHLDADDDGPLDEWLAASAAYALASMVGETGRRPGGICQAHDCDRPFVNTGSGAEQRYCSTRCASRARVAAHRQRSRGA